MEGCVVVCQCRQGMRRLGGRGADGFWHLSDDDDISQSAPLADCYHDECRVTALSPCVARFPYNDFSGDVQMMSLFSLSVKGHSLFYGN